MRDTELLSLIYEAGIGTCNWDEVLSEVMARSGAITAVLPIRYLNQPMEMRPPRNGPHPVIHSVGIGADDLDEYYRDFSTRNFRMDHIHQIPQGRVLVDGRDFPLSVVDGSDIQNQFHRPHGRGYALVARLTTFDHAGIAFSMHRERGQASFNEKQIVAVEEIVPHLSRAMLIRKQIVFAQEEAKALAMTLDHLQHAMILVSDARKVLNINQAAEQILRKDDAPLKIESGVVSALSSLDGSLLQRAISEASAALHNLHGENLRIVKLGGRGGKRVITLLAVPLINSSVLGRTSGAHVLLCLADPYAKPRLIARHLSQEFDLSVSEAQIGALLSAGVSLEQIAVQRRVSPETVRVQVKNMLRKTQTHSQVQLVAALLSGLAGFVSLPEDALAQRRTRP